MVVKGRNFNYQHFIGTILRRSSCLRKSFWYKFYTTPLTYWLHNCFLMKFRVDYSHIHSNSVDLIDENFILGRCFLDYSRPTGRFLKPFNHASFEYCDLIDFNYCSYSFLCYFVLF